MLRIRINTVPEELMRYDTVGDYWGDLGNQRIVITELADQRHEWLIAHHEMVESGLCHYRGIPEADITAFDMAYEETRKLETPAPCGCKHYEEPGNDPHAPYHHEHQVATIIERFLAHELGIHWATYNSKSNEGEE